MRKIISIALLVLLSTSCLPSGKLQSATATRSILPTRTQAPVPTKTVSLSLSATPDPFNQVLSSPNSKYVAKRYEPSPLEKPIIKIFDEQNKLLWQIPYQGEMPSGDPRPSLSIYKWANDSSGLYFYYAFHGDGGYTLTDGLNLQEIDIKTGKIERILPSTENIAFAFSPNDSQIAYGQSENTPSKLIIRNLSTKVEQYINIDISSERAIQVGWISWSPNGEGVLYHVETGEQAWAYYLDAKTLQQREILKFWMEEYWFDGWAQDNNPRYIDLHNNIVVIDVKTNAITIIGTPTPEP